MGQRVVILCLLLVTAACDDRPTGPTVVLDRTLTLSPGQVAFVDGVGVRLTFVDVAGDSRCPADAVCIQGGDAVVRVRGAAGTSTATLELHTGDATRAAASFQGVRVQLLELQPYPFSSRSISPRDYRASLRVTR
jgi:hypothetical protein